jgi:hypothetical protein
MSPKRLPLPTQTNSQACPSGPFIPTHLPQQNLVSNHLNKTKTDLPLFQQFGTKASKAEFISGLPYVPTVPGISTDDVFHLCTKVLWRWRFHMEPHSVRGMNVFEVDPVTKQITTNYVEFNSAVWMYDLGYTQCKPNATSYTPGPPAGAGGSPVTHRARN